MKPIKKIKAIKNPKQKIIMFGEMSSPYFQLLMVTKRSASERAKQILISLKNSFGGRI